MSYELVQEVRESAPLDLSATERLILIWIAEQSREEDRYYRSELIEARTCWPGRENLMRWSGISSERTFRAALQKLADRGLDVRVPLGVDRHGAVLYAVKGQRMVLRLPELRGQFSAATGQRSADKGAVERLQGGISRPPTHENPSTHEQHTVNPASQGSTADPWDDSVADEEPLGATGEIRKTATGRKTA